MSCTIVWSSQCFALMHISNSTMIWQNIQPITVPFDEAGDGGLYGGGGENGGAPGQGFVVPGPQRFGLLAKLWQNHKKVRIVNIRRHRFLFSTGRRTASEDAIKHPNSSRNYLIGVNRENEPLDGTPPERLLFERSLQDCQKHFLLLSNILNSCNDV